MKRAPITRLGKHGNALGIFLALAIFGVVIVLSVRSTLSADRGAAWVDHTRLVIESLDALALGFSEATSARRGSDGPWRPPCPPATCSASAGSS